MLPSCTLPAVTLPAQWPRLSCLCAFHGRAEWRESQRDFFCLSGLIVSVRTLKFLSGLSSLLVRTLKFTSGLPHQDDSAEGGTGRKGGWASIIHCWGGGEGCSEGSWKVEVSSKALVSTVKTVRRQDSARTLSGLCQDSVRTLSGLCQDCQDRCGRSTNQVCDEVHAATATSGVPIEHHPS